MRFALLAATAGIFAFPSMALANADAGGDVGAHADLAKSENQVIFVTATKRSEALLNVPVAVSVASAQALQHTGASDIRQLNQISPSLLVSSTASEAGAGMARIRGIGTLGDNPGLESSVAAYVDGVYRARSGVALTELGAVEQIDVIRGPQGTLFGRNASAGAIHVVTAKPSFESAGDASLSYGNHDYWRLTAGLTGALSGEEVAYRLDGVYTKRRGFVEDVMSGAHLNNRNRWLVRGQLLFVPNPDLSIRLAADYARRDENCCANTYLPFRSNYVDGAGNVQSTPENAIVQVFEQLGAYISDDTYGWQTAHTPGRQMRSDVQDWGLSADVNWALGFADLTSITAYRDWHLKAGQDGDFSSLDLLVRDNWNRHYRTFSQELRLNGKAFDNRLDWMVGAYAGLEKLTYTDDQKYGQDMDRYVDAVIRLTRPTFGGVAQLAEDLGIPGVTLSGRGVIWDQYDQDSRSLAVFTHNILNLTDQVQLTLGARYTDEKKTLDVNLNGNNQLCAAIRAAEDADIRSLAGLPCALSPVGQFVAQGDHREDAWTGTAALSWKPLETLTAYASWSRGYKAGGFNLDRSSLEATNPNLDTLRFAPETVRSFELGVKFANGPVQVNVAGFYSIFDQFQLNAYTGTTFVVENVQACKDGLGGADRDNNALTGACDADRLGGGVTSKGVEVEASLKPYKDLNLGFGVTYADTRYKEDLVGAGGRPLSTNLAFLPGQALSNAPEFVHTASLAWTPQVNERIGALVYVDYRLQSEINTGSDLLPEKWQDTVFVMNARFGLNGNGGRWSIEAWAQNLLNTQYKQTVFNAPLQGSGSIAHTQNWGTSSNQLFGAFLAEPRTFGVTVRTKF